MSEVFKARAAPVSHLRRGSEIDVALERLAGHNVLARQLKATQRLHGTDLSCSSGFLRIASDSSRRAIPWTPACEKSLESRRLDGNFGHAGQGIIHDANTLC
jgi:hypothetical protein